MDADKANVAGDPRTATVDTVETTPATDFPYLRGQVAERQDLDGAGATLRREWFGLWALRTVDGPETSGTGYITTRDAFMVRRDQNRVRVQSSAGLIRTLTAYTLQGGSPILPTTGMVTGVDDQGDQAVSTDSRCSTTDWVYNSSATVWLAEPAIQKTWSDTCGTGALLRRTDRAYDGATGTPFGASSALTLGDPTRADAYTTATAKITTSTAYGDAYGRLTGAVDGRGHTTTTAYTPTAGRATSIAVTGPDPTAPTGGGFTTTTTLEAKRGQPAQITDPNSAVTALTYDGLGRLKTVRRPTEQASGHDSLTFTYTTPLDATTGIADGVSKVKTSTLQTDSTSVYVDGYAFVDGWGRPIQTRVVSPASASQSIAATTRYNDRGQVQGASGPTLLTSAASAAWGDVDRDTLAVDTRTSWDALGRQTARAVLTAGTEQWRTTTTWDGLDSRADPPAGGDVERLADARGRTITVKEYTAAGTPTVYATTSLQYTDRDEIATVTTPLGQQAGYGYDLLGRRTSTTDPDTGASSSVYDANGNLVAATDARGTTVTTDYDNLDRPTRRTTGAGPTVLATWTYDTLTGGNGRGRLTSQTAKVVPPGGGTALDYTQAVTGYDADGRPLGSTWTVPAGFGVPAAVSYTETYGYDAAGHVTTLTRPNIAGIGAETATAAWTSLGRPASLTAAGTTLVDSTTFDGLGRLTGRRWSSPTGPARGYTYDGLNRLAEATANVSGTNVQDDTYAYTGSDLTKVTDTLTGQQQCYHYDHVRRLDHAWTTTNPGCGAANAGGPVPYDQAWTFDTDNAILTAADARAGTASTYTVGAPGKPYHAAGTVTGTGAATRGYDPSGYLTSSTDGGQSLTWDPLHRLTAVTASGATTRYAYLPDGTRLIRQTPTDTTLTLGGTDVVYPTAGAATARRYYTLAGVEVALKDNSTGSTLRHWLAHDPQASTDLSVQASTNTVTRTRYTPYGAVRATTPPGGLGTGLPTDHGWLGKTLDTTTGLVHLDHRYHDPALAQFTAPDPLIDPTNPRTLNPYTYANANPIALVDPTGLCAAPNNGDDGAQCANGSKAVSGHTVGSGNTSKTGGATTTQTSGGGGSPLQTSNWRRTCHDYGVGCQDQTTDTIGIDIFVGIREGLQDLIQHPQHLVTDPIDDAWDCRHGIVSACGWTALNVVFLGKGSLVKGVAEKTAAEGILAGSGRAAGVLEASSASKSVGAINAWNAKGGVEFVFDSETGTFAMGRPASWLGLKGSPHQQLAQVIGADSDSVVGGIVSRGSDGMLTWNEQSGHFWQNWTPGIRQQFVDTMRSYGVNIGG